MMPAWIVFGTVLYTFGWSRLFEPLRLDTVAFLAVAVVLFLGLTATVPTTPRSRRARPLDLWALAIIGVYFAGAYIINGGIPLIQIVTGGDYDIYGFGVDGLHIFMLCFTGYYGVRAWHAFLTRGGIGNLASLAGVTAILISIGNRSAVSFLFFACVIVFVRSRRISWRGWIGLAAAGLLFAFAFGVFGDVRLAYQIGQATGTPGRLDAVLQLARATDGFRDSGISPSWLWSYIYFVSPLANLNSAFAHAGGGVCGSGCELPAVAFYDLLPDVIGVRIADVLHVADIPKSEFIVAPDLTAATAFGSAVAGAGAIGGVLVLGWIAVVAVVSVWLLRTSPVREEGIALLATIIFFAFFENMVAYTSLAGQLVFPLALGVYARFRSRRDARARF